MTTHRLDPAPDTTADVFSREHAPVLRIDPGDTVVVRSMDASGYLARQAFPGEDQPKMYPAGRGHCLTGPISVRAARPGDMLALRLIALRPGDWGWTVAAALDTPVTRRLGLAGGPPSWLLWELDPDAGQGTANGGFARRLAPFLGVMGMPPDEPGALLYLGDGHAAQGDGEVGGTAIECGMTTEAVIDIVAGRPLGSIHAETPAGRVTFGFDADLNTAMGDALDAMVCWMQALFGLGKAAALALASTCVDLRITQVANQTWGVHAVLPAGIPSRTDGRS